MVVNGLCLAGVRGDILDGVDLQVGRGTTAIVTGATGAGKTTLLRSIAGLTTTRAGVVTFDGVMWRDETIGLLTSERSLGFVFQDLALWPHLRVQEQVEVTLGSLSRRDRRARSSEVLQQLDLWPLRQRWPAELSGGQQQRVAIARAVVRFPPLLLMDEPFNQQDLESRNRVWKWIQQRQVEYRMAIVVTTHDSSGLGAPSSADATVKEYQVRHGKLLVAERATAR